MNPYTPRAALARQRVGMYGHECISLQRLLRQYLYFCTSKASALILMIEP
jgi:hypothetical protein